MMTAETIERQKSVELTTEERRIKLDEHYEAIKRAELVVQDAQSEMLSRQQEVKDAKKSYESAVFSLRRLITRDPLYVPPVVVDPQLELDFNEEYDKRLHTPITEALALTEKQIEKLAEAGVKTVGDFEQLRGGQMKGYPNGLSDLDRVGQATIDKWEDQIVDFLKVTPAPQAESESEESPRVILLTKLFSGKILKALTENDPPIRTLGDLVDFKASKALTEIKGITTSSVELIENKMIEFWRDNKHHEDAVLAGAK